MRNLIEDTDYTVHFLDMPAKVRGLIVLDETGFPMVLINAKLNSFERKKAVRHELDHWLRNDHYNQETIRHAEGFSETVLEGCDGKPLTAPAALAPDDLKRIDAGLYLPRSDRAFEYVRQQLEALASGCIDALEALGWWDVEPPPVSPEDLRWIAFDQYSAAPSLRVESKAVKASIYPGSGAVAELTVQGRTITADLWPLGTGLVARMIHETTGGAWRELYANPRFYSHHNAERRYDYIFPALYVTGGRL